MAFIILSVVIQLALVIHIIKTGRSVTWVFIVLIFPLIGTLAYLIIELLPELTSSRTGRGLRRNFSKTLNPDKNLNTASQNLAVADTVQNAMTLATEYLEKSKYAEAKELFAKSLKGIHADDPPLLLGLARAQFGLGEFNAAKQTLDTLKEKNPTFKSVEGHLLYARTQEQLGNTADAIHEYEALCSYYPGPEPCCRLALILKSSGNLTRASELFQSVLNTSKISGKHYNNFHKEWIALARREING
ncbi:MAG: tetratricopeptide repeat protein [Gammaproteobacteria bacterium]|nr:tetratricopeptide repeat protein [Gammaproteobacteria bacterium]